jgi:hypothetical protein
MKASSITRTVVTGSASASLDLPSLDLPSLDLASLDLAGLDLASLDLAVHIIIT